MLIWTQVHSEIILFLHICFIHYLSAIIREFEWNEGQYILAGSRWMITTRTKRRLGHSSDWFTNYIISKVLLSTLGQKDKVDFFIFFFIYKFFSFFFFIYFFFLGGGWTMREALIMIFILITWSEGQWEAKKKTYVWTYEHSNY